nr:hypothetical protein Dp_00003 [Serratia proteamaculans]
MQIICTEGTTGSLLQRNTQCRRLAAVQSRLQQAGHGKPLAVRGGTVVRHTDVLQGNQAGQPGRRNGQHCAHVQPLFRLIHFFPGGEHAAVLSIVAPHLSKGTGDILLILLLRRGQQGDRQFARRQRRQDISSIAATTVDGIVEPREVPQCLQIMGQTRQPRMKTARLADHQSQLTRTETGMADNQR